MLAGALGFGALQIASAADMPVKAWSAKLEYLHYDFGNDIHYTPTTIAGGSSVHVLVRAGINYHFNLFR